MSVLMYLGVLSAPPQCTHVSHPSHDMSMLNQQGVTIPKEPQQQPHHT
jgi:hypothetical protein